MPTTTATGPVASTRKSCIQGLKTRPRSHKSWTTCRGLVTYTYDANGNIIKKTATATTTTHYGFNNADELCWSGPNDGSQGGSTCPATPGGDTAYTSDANGNLTSAGSTTYTYNAKNQTTNVGGTVFTYADAGQSLRTTAGTTTFVNGVLGLASQTTGSTTVYFTRDPSGNTIGTRVGAGAGGTNSYPTYDAVGSLLADTQVNGTADNGLYTYDPYGGVISAAGPNPSLNPYRFATGYGDTTGLDHMGDRYYSASSSRWTQQDPDGVGYAYAGDAPSSFADPTGRVPECLIDNRWLGELACLLPVNGIRRIAIELMTYHPHISCGQAVTIAIASTGVVVEGAVAKAVAYAGLLDALSGGLC